MKKLIIITAVLLAGITSMTAQQFDKTDAYFVSLQSTLNTDGEEVPTASLMTDGDLPQTITSFPIADAALIHDVHISVLKNPGLSGVINVLRVDVQYVEYCSYVVSNYILETSKGAYITLPIMTNEDCGDSNKELVYLFPNQTYGEDNKILTAEITVAKKNILNAEHLDAFIWNDDSYGTSGNLYEEL